jgi:hypothetical protein
VESHVFPVTGTLVSAPFRSHFGSNHMQDPCAQAYESQVAYGPLRDLVVAACFVRIVLRTIEEIVDE